jgi:N-carbamoylputrescine amidase
MSPSTLKITVCQFHDDPEKLHQDWTALSAHVKAEGSTLVLLPEMPFYPWLCGETVVDLAAWKAAVDAHDAWLMRLAELEPAIILGTRPLTRNGQRLNEGFIWDSLNGYQAAHTKYYLPREDGFWEAEWYQRGDGDFALVRGGAALTGFLICTEMWAMDKARHYCKAGAHLIVTPRATARESLDKWLAGGRALAVVSGAYSLSSNRVAEPDRPGVPFGGQGWIIDPDGAVLGVTSADEPFVTRSIDLAAAEHARHTYPRYALD